MAGDSLRDRPSDLIIVNASEVVTCAGPGPKAGEAQGIAGIISDGAVACSRGRIVDIATTEEVLKREPPGCPEVIDAQGMTVIPGFVDAHTHLVFAGSRHDEYIMRMKGARYLDILALGGGIMSTVRATRAASFYELLEATRKRLDIMAMHGTTTVEAKSGYGLTVESELKQLEVARAAGEDHPVDVVNTFMGAHAVPNEYRHDPEEYIRIVIEDMIPRVRGFAEFIDVFCEDGVFDVFQSRRILQAGRDHGLTPKLHADEIHCTGGAELAADVRAVSADHLAAASEQGLMAMAQAGVIAVLLPGTMFTLMAEKYAPARRMIDLGVPVALATDFNPGTSPVLSMQFVLTLACLEMKMTPAEAIVAATLNAAHALGRGTEVGSLELGKQADMAVCDVPSLGALPFTIGVNCVTHVVKAGRVIVRDGRLT